MTDTFLPGLQMTGGREISAAEALALAPSNTLVLGDSQMTLFEVPGEPDMLYMANCITRPDARLQGAGKTLMDQVCAMADAYGVTLATHPDAPWMEQRLRERRGFIVDPSKPQWDGKPFMIRPPAERELRDVN